jgi:hypothetical protein
LLALTSAILGLKFRVKQRLLFGAMFAKGPIRRVRFMKGPLSKQPPPVLKPASKDSSGDSAWPCPDCSGLAAPC